MHKDNLLIAATVISIVLLPIHVVDDIVHGFDSASVSAVIAMGVLAVLIYGTLFKRRRVLGYVSTLVVGIFALGMPLIHLRSARIDEVARASGGFFFILCLWAFGITGILGLILTVEGFWGLRRKPREVDATSNSS